MRIARLCKELGISPRAGGLLDQPAHELALLEKIFEANDKHQERLAEKDKRKQKFKAEQGGS